MDGYSGIVLDDAVGNDGYDGGEEIDGNNEKINAGGRGGGGDNISGTMDVDFVNI